MKNPGVLHGRALRSGEEVCWKHRAERWEKLGRRSSVGRRWLHDMGDDFKDRKDRGR